MTTDNVVNMPTAMNVLADRIPAGHERAERGRQEWIEGRVDEAYALAEARDRFPKDNNAFSLWLAENALDYFGRDDRAAMILLAKELPNRADLHFIFDRYADDRLQPNTIWQIVRQKRWEYRKARFAELKEGSSNDSNTPSPIEPTAETAANSPPTPVNPASTASENAADQNISSVNPAPVSQSLLTRSPFVKRKYPKADLVLGYMLHADTRSTLLAMLPPRRPGPLWALLIESIESGGFGPPDNSQINQPSLRLLLPWLSGTVTRRLRLDLTKAEDLATIRDDVLPIVLANRALLAEQPDKLVPLVLNHRADRENAARKQQAEQKHAAAVAKMPTSEQPVVAFGVSLWPRVTDDHRYTFGYDELCHAIWFSQYLLKNLPHEWTPTSKAIQARHLIKYVTPMLKAPGWQVAVRQFLLAYENNPEGECRIPPPPINFGM